MQLRVKKGYKIHIGKFCFHVGDIIPPAMVALRDVGIKQLLLMGAIEQVEEKKSEVIIEPV